MTLFLRHIMPIALMCFLSRAYATADFVTIALPKDVTISIPNNWTTLSNNRKMELKSFVEQKFDLNIDLSLPFFANYYLNDVAVGRVNILYYTMKNFTQQDVMLLSSDAMDYLDRELRKLIQQRLPETGATITSWEGSKRKKLNGVVALITEYHTYDDYDSDTFRVRLVRVFAGDRSLNLTVSYSERHTTLLKDITNKIIYSLSMPNQQ